MITKTFFVKTTETNPDIAYIFIRKHETLQDIYYLVYGYNSGVEAKGYNGSLSSRLIVLGKELEKMELV